MVPNDERFIDTNEDADDEEFDVQSDPMNPLIIAALADQVLPPLPDLDAEAAASMLTAEDRQALASQGDSADFIRRLIALRAAERASHQRPAAAETLYGQPDETIPSAGSPFLPAGLSPDLDDLMARLEGVQRDEVICCTSGYRKRHELGRGGQGVVYLTEDEFGGERALKIYSPLPYGNGAAYRQDMQRLLTVATQVHRIHHDNLVNVERFLEYHGIYVMVMQWIDGYDLRRLLEGQLLERLRQSVDDRRWTYLNNVIYATPAPGRVCLQPLLAVNIIEKCLRGLSALHQNGIVHGDIKPSNVMLDCSGSIRLIDFGSAYYYQSPPRVRTWTPRYAPPEFLERGEWTPQSDLASLGYLLIELLSGRPDIGGPRIGEASTRTSDRHREEALLEAKRCLPQRLPDLLPENVRRSEKLLRLCRKLIDPDPARRFGDANKAIEEDGDGTWHFRQALACANLAVHEASAIQGWVKDVKKVTRG